MLQYVSRSVRSIRFQKPFDMDPLLYDVLCARGIRSAEEADLFLHPDPSQLSDPFRLLGMSGVVERIEKAIIEKEPICVYGDYDVDGVCASSILADYLVKKGAVAEIYLPSRHKEGYGLNEPALRSLANRIKLLITVDCGISSYRLIETARSLKLDVIVTDHHQLPAVLPYCLILHPQIGDYPCPLLCGAGVALKLVQALGGLPAALDYLDLAALATVADIVPLTGENRAIVSLGLKMMNESPRYGIRALLEHAGIGGEKKLTSTGIAFQLAPRLNAGGRLDSAMIPVRLLLSKDPEEADLLADALEDMNQERRRLLDDILARAEETLKGFSFPDHRIIIICGEDWNPGVIGLVAGRLTEEYNYPSIVLTRRGDLLTGSCRSIPGVHIFNALSAVKHLLDHFGGHEQAAGVSLKPENLIDLQAALDKWISDNVSSTAYIPHREYDLSVPFDRLSLSSVEALAALEPTGCDNPAPVFRADTQISRLRRVGAEGKHLQLGLISNGIPLPAIYFGAGDRVSELTSQADILYEPSINTFNGHENVQIRIKSLLCAGRPDFVTLEPKLQHDFLTDLFYNINEKVSLGSAAITVEQLRELLRADPQGTLLLAADPGTSIHVLDALKDVSIDLLTGTGQTDPRCFNTLIVYPNHIQVKGYRRIVYIGMPVIYRTDAESYYIRASVPWAAALADIDQLRNAYRLLRDTVRSPKPVDVHRAASILCGRNGMEYVQNLAYVYALMAADLFKADDRGNLSRTETRKTDPKETPFWRLFTLWKDPALQFERREDTK